MENGYSVITLLSHDREEEIGTSLYYFLRVAKFQ